MYEDRTYENILQEMLDRVTEDVDKREGSVIYDALAPAAYFLADQYFQLNNFIDLVFCDTAVGEYLDRAVNGYGINRKAASAAIRKVTTSGDIAIGTRWMISDVVYRITGQVEENSYEAECETPGKIGNTYSGSVEPLSAVSGVTAELTDIITDGADEEMDEALRNRFYEKVRRPATSGNAYQYRQWALEVSGVGDAKVTPLAYGPGTVEVLVIDSDKKVSSGLPEKVAEYLETVRPIGATVTVNSPEELQINVAATIRLDGTQTMDSVKNAFTIRLTEFLQELAFSSYRVSYARLGSVLLDVPGVADLDTYTLNDSTGNLIIGEKQIPVVGTISMGEANTIEAD